MNTQEQRVESFIPMVKVNPTSIIGYYQFTGTRRKAWQSLLFSAIDPESNETKKEQNQLAYTGELTKSARKKLKEACEVLYAVSTSKKVYLEAQKKSILFRLGLCTLTLSAPQGTITDREIKKELLEPFLRHYRNKGLINYVWKAERQENGNVHFHIISDYFFDKTDLTNYWNKLQAKLGFIENFYKKHGHRNPPSTNVKKVKTKKGLVIYLLKYMLKPAEKGKQLEAGREIDKASVGKIWDCSINLKIKNDTSQVIEDWQFELLQKADDEGKLKRIDSDYCTIYVPRNGELIDVAPKIFRDRLRKFLEKVKEKGKESRAKILN